MTSTDVYISLSLDDRCPLSVRSSISCIHVGSWSPTPSRMYIAPRLGSCLRHWVARVHRRARPDAARRRMFLRTRTMHIYILTDSPFMQKSQGPADPTAQALRPVFSCFCFFYFRSCRVRRPTRPSVLQSPSFDATFWQIHRDLQTAHMGIRQNNRRVLDSAGAPSAAFCPVFRSSDDAGAVPVLLESHSSFFLNSSSKVQSASRVISTVG